MQSAYDIVKLHQDLARVAINEDGLRNAYLANNCDPISVIKLVNANMALLKEGKHCHFLRHQLFRVLNYQDFGYHDHYQLWLKYLELAQAYAVEIQSELNWKSTIESWRFLASLAEASGKLNFSHAQAKVDLLTAFETAAVATTTSMEDYDSFWFQAQLKRIAVNLAEAKEMALRYPDVSN